MLIPSQAVGLQGHQPSTKGDKGAVYIESV